MKAPANISIHPRIKNTITQVGKILISKDGVQLKQAILNILLAKVKDAFNKKQFRRELAQCKAIPLVIDILVRAHELPNGYVKTKDRERAEKLVPEIEEKAAEVIYFLIKEPEGQKAFRESRHISNFAMFLQGDVSSASPAQKRMLSVIERLEKKNRRMTELRQSMGSMATKALFAGGKALATAIHSINEALKGNNQEAIQKELHTLISISKPNNTDQRKCPKKEKRNQVSVSPLQYKCILTYQQMETICRLLTSSNEGILFPLCQFISQIAVLPNNRGMLSWPACINSLKKLSNGSNPSIALYATRALLTLKKSAITTPKLSNKKIKKSLRNKVTELASQQQTKERNNYITLVHRIIKIINLGNVDTKMEAIHDLKRLLNSTHVKTLIDSRKVIPSLINSFFREESNKQVKDEVAELICTLNKNDEDFSNDMNQVRRLTEIGQSNLEHNIAATKILRAMTQHPPPHQKNQLQRAPILSFAIDKLSINIDPECRMELMTIINNELKWKKSINHSENISSLRKKLPLLSGQDISENEKNLIETISRQLTPTTLRRKVRPLRFFSTEGFESALKERSKHLRGGKENTRGVFPQ